GDIIQYFVVAQDLNGTPRVGLNAGAFTTQPTSVALTAANFPLTSTINQYTIAANTYSGVIPVGSSEAITSLTNAGGLFALINAGTLSGNVTVSITSDLTAELGTNALNQWAETGAGGYTITIQPSAATTRLISGTSTSGLIRLDQADRVIIDGRFGGSGQFLTFRNLSTSAATISLLNDATNNVITYNEIRDRSDATGRPVIGIFSAGTTTALPQYNNNCRISNNNIHDFFADGSTAQSGITVSTGNSGWSIDSNSVYQTATRTNSLTGGTTRGIFVSFGATVASNGGFNIRNNFIGGTAPGATGGDWTINVTPASSITHVFIPLTVSTGLIPNTVTGNTIRNIDFTTVSPTANATQFAAMNLAQGFFTVSGNTIGSPTTTGNIKININVSTGTNATSFLAGLLFGTSATCGIDFLNNNIGSITIGGSATAAVFMQTIQIQGNPVAAPLLQGNVIGSTSAANSIQTSFTGTAQFILFGIRSLASTSYNATVNNNTIQNITDNSTNAASAEYGILMISSVGATSNLTVTNNTVGNISSNTSQPAAAFSCIGISIQNVQSPNSNISGNTIFGIRNINAGVTGAVSVGFQTQNNLAGGDFAKNKIYDLTSVSTGTGQIFGAYVSSASGWNFTNNMISLTNGESSLDQTDKLNAFNNKSSQDIQPTDFNQMAIMYRPSANYVYDRSKEEAGVQEVYTQETIYANDPVTTKNIQKKD
ncbi:MAG TPA: hypothetical protein PKA39_08140, partial [Ignavibacteria bacterium]|nr:hypothetical protein [Ignavibacteria bacterium]